MYHDAGAVALGLADEVQGELALAHDYLVAREAEAPHQFLAIQSFRAAMAVLRRQRQYAGELYDRGLVDAGDRDEIGGVIDARIRHLDITGPVWRPPSPSAVLLSLDFLAGAPPAVVDLLMRGGSLRGAPPPGAAALRE